MHVTRFRGSRLIQEGTGAREILECWFANKPIRDDYLIVDGGKLAGAGAHSCSA
jgi:formate dehydrogenase